jgi:hypothetical protein
MFKKTMCTAASVDQIAKELSTIELRKLYAMISDDVTLNQSPKRAKNKDSSPMFEIDIDKRLLTQVFNVDLDKDIKE